MNKKLRYRISQWEQAVKCKSNLSDKYSIHVSSIEYLPDITGKVIQVEHATAGTVFATMLDPKGERVDSAVNLHPLSTKAILNNLAVFGFDIQYEPEASLPIEQKKYLQELLNLYMDKIRILYVFSDDNGSRAYRPVLTAFSSVLLTDWLLNSYTCSRDEFDRICGSGDAIRLDTRDFDWSWLTYVANIKDLIEKNQ